MKDKNPTKNQTPSASTATHGYVRQMTKVAKAVQKLYDTYKEYTHFDYTCGTNNGEFYEKWNIYTPTITHNTFSTSEKLIDFINDMIKDKNSIYQNHRLSELHKDKKRYEEMLQETIELIKELST